MHNVLYVPDLKKNLLSEGVITSKVPESTAVYGTGYSPISDKACHLVGHSDANFASDVDIRKLTSAYVFKFSNGPRTLGSQNQLTVSTLTTKAKYIATSDALTPGCESACRLLKISRMNIFGTNGRMRSIDTSQWSVTGGYPNGKGCSTSEVG
ncbi:hypothetical protein NPIL_591281 [Nephila pilipes]|uniref:Uncharacterized protein n=1 Tax=Nephila pilipes TaxID=299642 RepID=A0A8X6QUC4_NEPPI|nr:hypothetical protein NPIL_591281 [Nephila pilipes]